VTRYAHPNTLDLPDRKFVRQRLLVMKPGEFEEIISQLLAGMGFEMVEVTGQEPAHQISRVAAPGGFPQRGASQQPHRLPGLLNWRFAETGFVNQHIFNPAVYRNRNL
jgi:hypothetical protein